MSIRQTSKKVYEQIKQEGTQGSQKQIVYDLIEAKTLQSRISGITLKEISRELNLEINAVSGRVNDLKKEGKISECPKRKCTITNRMVMPVTIGSGDVGGTAHANINKKGYIEEDLEQSGFGFDVATKKRDVWPD
tara:strand:+ start:287 stop:691 length:405 start_codon:yes stop_codon:yes gene_type:complete